MQFPMTLRLIKILTIITCLLITVRASGQISINNTNTLDLDTSNTVIIKEVPFDRPFDSTFTEATLTQVELKIVDSILKAAVVDYNKSLEQENKNYRIDTQKRKYLKQLVVATNPKGEKEVWVNCLCYTGQIEDTWWKEQIISVFDGGSCFFNLKINLSTKKYYDFRVNPKA